MYDVCIIGAGPAGLSAAIYTARGKLKTLIFGVLKNSNAYKAHVIENYFGFEGPISGPALMEQGKAQALHHGAEFVEREVVDISANADGTFSVTDAERNIYQARAVIVCSGLGFKPSGIKNEQTFTGRGVSFCVTCDGPFFKNKKVVVIGNTNFAGEEALNLLPFTPHVSVVSHGKDFSFSPIMQEGLAKHSIQLCKTSRMAEFFGNGKLEKIKAADGSEFQTDGAFIALGIASASDFANKLGVERTGPQNAYIVADSRTGVTNVKGIFAAGDCTGGVAQAAKSSGEGCNAAISAIKFLRGVSAYVDYS